MSELWPVIAKVAELVDALDLGSSAEGCGGSSPPFRTSKNMKINYDSLVINKILGIFN
jgi:hypothetical protein